MTVRVYFCLCTDLSGKQSPLTDSTHFRCLNLNTKNMVIPVFFQAYMKILQICETFHFIWQQYSERRRSRRLCESALFLDVNNAVSICTCRKGKLIFRLYTFRKNTFILLHIHVYTIYSERLAILPILLEKLSFSSFCLVCLVWFGLGFFFGNVSKMRTQTKYNLHLRISDEI